MFGIMFWVLMRFWYVEYWYGYELGLGLVSYLKKVLGIGIKFRGFI